MTGFDAGPAEGFWAPAEKPVDPGSKWGVIHRAFAGGKRTHHFRICESACPTPQGVFALQKHEWKSGRGYT